MIRYCNIHGRAFSELVCQSCARERDEVQRIASSKSIASQVMDVWEDKDLVERTWNTAYPDRRPWSEIGQEAQEEWRRVFAIYDSLKDPRTEIIETRKS